MAGYLLVLQCWLAISGGGRALAPVTSRSALGLANSSGCDIPMAGGDGFCLQYLGPGKRALKCRA